MKALVYENYAQDDNFESILELRNVPEPVPKPNEVIFRVKAASLNYDDIWGMRGKPLAVPLPHISGTDAAGEVTAIGDNVKNIKVGDRIVSHGNMSCRVCAACTDGREYDCRQRKIWGFETGPLWGGYCEITHLPEINVVKIPDNVSYEEAAAASMTLLTSWDMLIGRAKIKPGQIVLVMGGSSGVGIFGIQIAKLYGCTVIATANTKGRGSDDGKFIGTNILNEAFLERFPITMEQPYPALAVEKKIVLGSMAKYGKVDEDFAEKLVTWAEVIRKTYFEGAVDELISTRRLDHIVKAFTIFKDKLKSIEMCTNRFDEDTKTSFIDLYSKVDAGVDLNEENSEEESEEEENSDMPY